MGFEIVSTDSWLSEALVAFAGFERVFMMRIALSTRILLA